MNQSEYDKALEFFTKCLKIEQKESDFKDNKRILESYNNIALVYQNKSEFTKAIEYLMKSLEINKKLFSSKNLKNEPLATVLSNIGTNYLQFGQYKKALEYYDQSMNIFKKLYGKEEHLYIAHLLTNKALVHKNLGDYDSAIKDLNKSLLITRRIFTNKHPLIGKKLSNIASIHSLQDNRSVKVL